MSESSRGPVCGSLSPPVVGLLAAFEALFTAGPSPAGGPSAAGMPSPAGGPSADLGVLQVEEADLAALADLHERLAAEIARRIVVVEAAGDASVGTATLLAQRGWHPAAARRMRVLARFADRFPDLADGWRSGAVAAHQVSALSRLPKHLSEDQAAGVIAALLPELPRLGARETARAVQRAIDLLAADDPDDRERSDHDARHLVWSAFRGGLVFSGYLPATEAAAFRAAVDACAEEVRVQGSVASAAQRRADGLASLVAKAAAHGLPTGGGAPATLALTVSLTEAERIASRDPARPQPEDQRDSRAASALAGPFPSGDAAVRFGLCCAAVTPVLVDQRPDGPQEPPIDPGGLLGRLVDGPVQPLAVGRSQRLATTAQRLALRLRDGGCVIPDCAVDAAYTQPHHVVPWSLGGSTTMSNLASLCWVHHRQVDQGRWDLLHTDDVPEPDDLPFGSRRHGLWWVVPLDAHSRRMRRQAAHRAAG